LSVRERAPESFTTLRLRGHRVDGADAPFFETMFSDPRVYATLGGARDASNVASLVAAKVREWDHHGFGTWVLRPSAGKARLGWVGLKPTNVGGAGGTELLYAISADHWGRGYATEAASTVVAIGDDHLGIEELVAFALTTNIGSRRVMEHVGFAYERDIEHAGLPHALYRRRRVDG
jgi:RimJ/RimL family protein N-acetyltransferase